MSYCQGMDGEPVDLAQEYGKRRVGRWRSGWEQGWDSRTVELGQLADKRWYVDVSRSGTQVYGDENTARTVLARVLAGGEWREEPAEWTNRGVPADPSWSKVGGRWVRG
jgi:hypothetical protein